jgi:hypothetical protein
MHGDPSENATYAGEISNRWYCSGTNGAAYCWCAKPALPAKRQNDPTQTKNGHFQHGRRGRIRFSRGSNVGTVGPALGRLIINAAEGVVAVGCLCVIAALNTWGRI